MASYWTLIALGICCYQIPSSSSFRMVNPYRIDLNDLIQYDSTLERCPRFTHQPTLTYPKNAHFGMKRSNQLASNQQIKRDEFYRITKRSIIPSEGLQSMAAKEKSSPNSRVKRSFWRGPRFLIIKGGIVCESQDTDSIAPEFMNLPEGEWQQHPEIRESKPCAPGENCMYSKRDSQMGYF
ncbi:hypothetical protein TCAL_10070 [Tigriopus californicus]|uniref:Uncharacterized protein n=1 Tax=Tigriopus californicus TaxID=6832 RepID=A0A553N724_TIGCA|nr:uncharacterized protein LOC131884582 [Tigriopus californicus]TRY61203.1 hypothetical protein TCAL_10070 [Tigriopus californicus]